MKSDYLFFEGSAPGRVRPRVRRECLVPRLHQGEPPPEAHGFFSTVLGQADLDVTNYRARALNRRITACLRSLGAPNVEEGRRKIRVRPELLDAALNSVLLGVTDFFRDPAVFETLRFSLLPSLLQRHANLRVWSAACSDGQELYSVAMLLAEEGVLDRCELLGTDCRRDAIRQARTGIFSSEHVARLSSHWRKNFFDEGPISARIRRELVQRTDWKTADLFTSIEPGPWHLVLWRNMAIYLEPVPAEGIWQKLASALVPGGYLVTGKADHPPAGLPLIRIANCIFQKPVVSP